MSWLQLVFTVILEPKKIKSVTISIFTPSICHEVMGPDAMILVLLNVEFWVSFFSLLLHLDQEAVWFLFAFCHEGGVICISEVVDTSPGNLDSSLCFIQPTTFGMRY